MIIIHVSEGPHKWRVIVRQGGVATVERLFYDELHDPSWRPQEVDYETVCYLMSRAEGPNTELVDSGGSHLSAWTLTIDSLKSGKRV